MIMNCQLKQCYAKTNQNTFFAYRNIRYEIIALNKLFDLFQLAFEKFKWVVCMLLKLIVNGKPVSDLF